MVRGVGSVVGTHRADPTGGNSHVDCPRRGLRTPASVGSDEEVHPALCVMMICARGRDMLTALVGTGGVYKAAGLPDVRFSRIPKEVIDPVVEELGERLQMLFPDMRRGQGWFARWALGRRHKSRGRSGAGCR